MENSRNAATNSYYLKHSAQIQYTDLPFWASKFVWRVLRKIKKNSDVDKTHERIVLATIYYIDDILNFRSDLNQFKEYMENTPEFVNIKRSNEMIKIFPIHIRNSMSCKYV